MKWYMWLIGVVVVLAGVWYFFLRDSVYIPILSGIVGSNS